MRTTLTLDDELFTRLKNVAHERGVPLKQVVNEAIRSGLERPRKRRPFKQQSFSMGRPKVDLTKANRIAAELEDEEILRKLRRES